MFPFLETFYIFVPLTLNNYLMRYFQTLFLIGADKFIRGLNQKDRIKVLYNIDLAEKSKDPRIFKKLENDIWEFRINAGGQQIRLLAFWDKTNNKETWVFATHGFIKKVDKVSKREIDRAINIKNKYFEIKQKE